MSLSKRLFPFFFLISFLFIFLQYGFAETADFENIKAEKITIQRINPLLDEKKTDSEKALYESTRITLDFSFLRSVHPDAYAWLYQPNTSVNLPILFSEKLARQQELEQYYAKRDNGAVLLKKDTIYAKSSIPTKIYGKTNRRNRYLGSLVEYKDQAYYEKNPSFYLLTENKEYRLDAFALVQLKHLEELKFSIDSADNSQIYQHFPDLLEKSYFKSKKSFLPESNDQFFILFAENQTFSENSYVLFTRKRPLRYSSNKIQFANKIEMDSRDTQNLTISIPGLENIVLYAQNDPLWGDLLFEGQHSTKKRPFRDGGCGPTSIAMAIANLVPKDEIIRIKEFAKSPLGYSFCSCSVNEYHCNQQHLKYKMESEDEFYRYFPIAVANFATANNVWGIHGRTENFGTSLLYMNRILNLYGIQSEKVSSHKELIEAIKQKNALAIANVTTKPFTNRGHFLILIHTDDSYLYVLDPFRRESYSDLDKAGILEIISPGFVRVKLENIDKCGFKSIFLLTRNQE